MLIEYKEKTGYTQIAGVKEGTSQKIDFGILDINNGQGYEGNTGDQEAGLVILSGTCTIEGEGFRYINVGERKNVFVSKPQAIYLPAGTEFRISTPSWVEIAVFMAPSGKEGKPKLMLPEDMTYTVVGRLHWARYAHFMIDPIISGSEDLYVGEVIFPPGHWQFPPHSHDYDEEIYFYKVCPQNGFGIQMVYTEDKKTDEIYKIKNNDTMVVPQGYHPVASSPGDTLYVLWVMSPAPERRPLILKPDPRYAWAVGAEWMADEFAGKIPKKM
jgi:5-deoxy-glucuronate isomerase